MYTVDKPPNEPVSVSSRDLAKSVKFKKPEMMNHFQGYAKTGTMESIVPVLKMLPFRIRTASSEGPENMAGIRLDAPRHPAFDDLFGYLQSRFSASVQNSSISSRISARALRQ